MAGQASLWREGFRSFGRHRQEWLKCAIYFFLALLPAGYVILWQTGYSIGNPIVLDGMIDNFRHIHDPEYLKAHREAFTATVKNLPKPGLALIIAAFVAHLIIWIQIYVFYGLFMKYEGVVGNVKWDWKGFLYFTFKLLQWWLLIMLLIIAGVLIMALATAILVFLFRVLPLPPDVQKILASLSVFGASLAGMVGMIYVMMRYILVFPLAAAWVKSPITTSARLMRGNTWRYFWNMLWLYIIFLPIFFLLFLLMFGSGQIVGGNIPAGIVLAIAYAALMLFIGGFFAAFQATVCRIFYEEKRQADPSFVLESRL